MSFVQIDWHPDRKGLRSFGVSMLAGFGLIGLAFYLGWPFSPNVKVAYGCWIFGFVSGILGLTGTKVALPFYWLWMGIAFIMGNIMSRLLIASFFYFMITPMGLFMRLIGRDKLALRRRTCDTYWCDVPPPTTDRRRYERQF